MVKQSRNRQRGKESEKVIAKLFGGQRIGLLGKEDIFHPKYSIEVKSRKKFVGRKWFDQCEKNNIDNKIPIVVIHEANKPHNTDLVLIKVKDLLDEKGEGE